MQANKKIDHLQSELNESKKLGEKFQEAAEKAQESWEKLSEEYGQLRKSIETEIKTEVAKLQNRFTDCIPKLEEKLKQMLPDYNVSCHANFVLVYSHEFYIKFLHKI